MNKVIISTVGTSLFTNLENEEEKTTDEQFLDMIEKKELSSAELSVLNEFELDTRDTLFFISTNSTRCKRICDIYEKYFSSKGIVSYKKVLKYYRNDYNLVKERGLSELFKVLAKINNQYDNCEIIINATGGYKAQTAYATLFGILSKNKVAYKALEFNRIIYIPPLPITCDKILIDSYYDDFAKIVNAKTNKEAREILDRLPKELQDFFMKKDKGVLKGYQYSSMGELFLDLYKKENLDELRINHPIYKTKEHSTLFGDGIDSINKISDEKVRTLFERVYLHKEVAGIYLDEFTMQNNSTEETYMEYRGTESGQLRYYLYNKRGRQYIKIQCIEGTETKLLDKLGRKIYF